MSGITLRDYQVECIDALEKQRHTGLNRLAVVMATGLGKTITFANDIDNAVKLRKNRCAIIVHREELASQAREKLHMLAPHLSVGLIKAGDNDFRDRDVVILSIQTVSRENRLTQIDPWFFGEITIDECHHSAADSYLRVMNYFGCFGSTMTTGWTATLSREDKRGLGNVWQGVAYKKDILYGIENGYLRDVKGKAVMIDEMNLADVARSRGDYQDGSLAEAMESAGAGPVVAEAFLEHGVHDHGPNGYRQALGFAPTVASAQYFNSEFNHAGIKTEVVIGETPTTERRSIYRAVSDGELQGIWSCGVLTEGFDLPPLSCAVMARPTISAGFYVQMAGRVLRPDLRPDGMLPSYRPEGTSGLDIKTRPIPDALLLDAVGVTGRHKLAGMADLTSNLDVDINDDETLSEAAFRSIEEADAKEAKRRRDHYERASRMAGNVEYEDVDLFHRSMSVWLQTNGGVWFIPTRTHTFFLWPDEAATSKSDTGEQLWMIGIFAGYSSKGGVWFRNGLPLGYAMGIAEAEAIDYDPSVSQRNAPWRRKSNKPSEGQLAVAVRYNIEDAPLLSKSDLSDRISIHIASRILDRRIKK